MVRTNRGIAVISTRSTWLLISFFLKILPCILWLTSVEFFVLAKINCNAICTDISLHFAVYRLLKHIQKWNYSALWRCRLTFQFSSKFCFDEILSVCLLQIDHQFDEHEDRMFVNSFHFPYTIFLFFYSDNFWTYYHYCFYFFGGFETCTKFIAIFKTICSTCLLVSLTSSCHSVFNSQ